MNTRGDMRGKLLCFLNYVREHGSAEMYGKQYTGVSIDKLCAVNGGGSVSTWEKYIHAWIKWGLLGVPNHSVSENNVYEVNAMEYARLTGNRNATTMYTVTRWTREQLLSLKPEKGSGTKANQIHKVGQAEADRIYGDRRGIAEAIQDAERQIIQTIRRKIEQKGYCTRGELRQCVCVVYEGRNGKNRRVNVDPVFEDMRPEIERQFRYDAPNAEVKKRLRDQYGAEIKGREFIITEMEAEIP